MRSPAVSAVARCAEPLADGRRYVAVRLLTQQRLYFAVDVSTRSEGGGCPHRPRALPAGYAGGPLLVMIHTKVRLFYTPFIGKVSI